jgi:rhodanese-related sulfurtransferase
MAMVSRRITALTSRSLRSVSSPIRASSRIAPYQFTSIHDRRSAPSYPSARPFSLSITLRKEAPLSPASETPIKVYDYSEIASISSSPDPSRILIDVREPSELQSTGTIPTSRNVPLNSSPDSFFLPAEEFEDKYGFERPGKDVEVIFYCKAGVRSKAAAQLARQAGFGGKVSEYSGSWKNWEKNGGAVQKV